MEVNSSPGLVHIVNAESDERRQQMLHRGYANAVFFQRGRQLGIADVLRFRGYLDGRIQVRATDYNSAVGRSRPQRQIHLFRSALSSSTWRLWS